jgi:hypothetical protein
VVGEHLEDRLEVADRHLLAQQVLQHLLHLAEREHLGHEVLHQARLLLAHPGDQALGLGAREQVRAPAA